MILIIQSLAEHESNEQRIWSLLFISKLSLIQQSSSITAQKELHCKEGYCDEEFNNVE